MAKHKQKYQQKFASINKVYSRIIWDSRLDNHAFIIGYQDNVLSEVVREKPLVEWDSEGDIAWSQICYLRCGDIVVWDRGKNIDLFTSDNLPAIAWQNKMTTNTTSNQAINTSITTSLNASERNIPQFNARAVYKFDAHTWQVVNDDFTVRDLDENSHKNIDINKKNLIVVTFNILCNLYESENIYTSKRLPIIIEHLQQTNADIIAIQEATPDFVELILAENWVQQGYYISEISPAPTVKPFGNLILSRFPFTLVDHRFFGHKRVLVGTWKINHSQLHVAAVHLTSDRGKNAPIKRKQQLTILLTYLQSITENYSSVNCLIMGDFNTRGNEQKDTFAETNFIDVWQVLRSGDTGYTFDPRLNPLAALMSREGNPARFDRILLQTSNQEFIPESIDIFACEPIPQMPDIYPSDHFGVRAVLGFGFSKN